MGKSAQFEGLTEIPGLPILSEVEAVCQKHGKYMQKTVLFNGKRIVQDCQCCIKEEIDKSVPLNLEAKQIEAKRARVDSLFGRSGVAPKFKGASFDAFEISTQGEVFVRQTKVVDLCRKYASNFKLALQEGAGFIFAGPSGTGKTFLSCAISNHIIADGFSSLFMSAADIVQRYEAASHYSSTISQEDLTRELVGSDLLIIDEADMFSGEQGRQVLIKLINDRYENNRPIIMLSNVGVSELKERIAARSISRMGERGMYLPFDWPSHRENLSKITPDWMR